MLDKCEANIVQLSTRGHLKLNNGQARIQQIPSGNDPRSELDNHHLKKTLNHHFNHLYINL